MKPNSTRGLPRILPLLLPLVYVAAPTLALYASNAGQARIADTFLPFAVLAGCTVVLYPLYALLCRGAVRGAVVMALHALIVFSYAHAATLLKPHTIAGMNPANPKGLVPAAVLAGALCFWAVRRTRREPRELASVLLICGLAMISVSTFSAVRFQASRQERPALAGLPDSTVAARTAYMPDIYFLVFDRYGAGSILRERYAWDNGPFETALRARGFYVADDSRGNYLGTAQSLASTLNMTHLLPLSKSIGSGSSDWLPIFDMIENNRVVRYLAAQGYRYVHVGSSWRPTAHNRLADENHDYRVLPEFSGMLISTTVFYPVLYRMGVTNPDREKYERIQRQLQIVAGVPSRPHEPTFLFGHFLCPHAPYVFNGDGTYRTPEEIEAHTEAESYAAQVEFLNRMILSVVDSLLAAYPADRPPVIVLQGDEGPYPPRTQPQSFDWASASDQELSEKMRILNAILARGCEDRLYPSITPVNTFRVLFDCTFGANFAPVPDKSYAYRDLSRLYDYFETTARIDAAAP